MWSYVVLLPAIIDNHKKSFFRSVNAIFGKVGRIATDEVILQLVFFKVYTRVVYMELVKYHPPR